MNFFRSLFGGSAKDSAPDEGSVGEDDEEGTRSLPGAPLSSGILSRGGPFERASDSRREGDATTHARHEPRESEEPLLSKPITGLGKAAREFSRHARWPKKIFGNKTVSSIRRLEGAVEAANEASSPGDRTVAKRGLRRLLSRQPGVRTVRRKLDTYVSKKLKTLRAEHEHDLRRLEERGADAHDLRQLTKSLETEERRVIREADRRLYRPLRRLARRVGGNPLRLRPPNR